MLFVFICSQLFGEDDPDQDVSPDTEDPEAVGDAGHKALNSSEIKRVSTREWAQETDYSPEKLFNKFFHDDIKYLLSMSMYQNSQMKIFIFYCLLCFRQSLGI